MKKFCTIFLFLSVSTGFVLTAQPYIGRHARDVEQYIRIHRSEFTLDQTTRNTVYRYLKFVDQMGYKTLLVFLSDQDTCTWYKVIYDYDLLDNVVSELNVCCKPESDTSWIETIGNNRYCKVMKKNDWFFSVSTHQLEKNDEQ